MSPFVLFVVLLATHTAVAVDTVVRRSNHSLHTTTHLCTSTKLDEGARAELRVCLELDYHFCIDTSLVRDLGVQLQTNLGDDVRTAALAVDQALVALYEPLANRPATDTACVYHWRNYVCSLAFMRRSADADDQAAHRPCRRLCLEAQAECRGDLNCVSTSSDDSLCTDFYKHSNVHSECKSLESGGTSSGGAGGNSRLSASSRRLTVQLSVLILFFSVVCLF